MIAGIKRIQHIIYSKQNDVSMTNMLNWGHPWNY